MSTKVVTPSEILSLNGRDLRTELQDAVINAYMMKYIDGVGGLRGNPGRSKLIDGGKGDLVFDYVIDGLPDRHFAVKYPSGEWREVIDLGWDDDSLNHGDHVDDLGGPSITIFDAITTWDNIREIVDSWLDPWVNWCPNPNDFKSQIDDLANIANKLYVGRTPNAGAGSGNAGSGGNSGVVDLRTAMDQMQANITGTSAGVYAFTVSYGIDIWNTIGGQQSMAAALAFAVTAEAMAWNQTYIDLQNFINVAIHDFNSYAASTEGSGEGTAVTLSAVSTVAGLAGGTVGVAFPPFGIAMAGVSATAAMLGLMFPATQAVADESVLLKGGDYLEYWGSFKKQMQKISNTQATAERNIVAGVRNVLDDEQNNPDNYSLTREGKVDKRHYGEQGADDQWKKMMSSKIDVIPIRLKRVGGACEMIGDHQIKLANLLPGTIDSGIWYRTQLPEGGAIGMDWLGPYNQVESLLTRLSGLLSQEGNTSHSVAERVMAMALGYEDTDTGHKKVINGYLDRWAAHFDDGKPIDS